MITVIDEYSSDVANLYEGKSLADACDMMVLETYQAVSDFKMDILLTEHAYLYENSCEISYVTEAGEETKEGKSLGQKIDGLIEKVRKFISDLWGRFINWLEERIADITTFFYKIGFNKKKFNEAMDNFDAAQVVIKGSKWALADDIVEAATGMKGFYDNYAAGNKLYEAGEFFNEYAVKLDSAEYEPMKKEAIIAAGKVVFEANDAVKKIKKARKDCDDALIKLKKNAKSEKADNMSDVIDGIDKTLKNNANVCKDKIKLYQKYLNANAAVVKDVVKMYNEFNKRANKDKAADSKLAKAKGKLLHNNEDWESEKRRQEREQEAPMPFKEKEEKKENVKESAIFGARYFSEA